MAMAQASWITLGIFLWAVTKTANAWNYAGQDAWGDSVATCSGNNQSPIDLTLISSNIVALPPLTFGHGYLEKTRWRFFHNENFGYWLQRAGSVATLAGGPLTGEYNLVTVEFHMGSDPGDETSSWQGSEHTVNGARYEAELHLVHRKNTYATDAEALGQSDGFATIAIMFHNNVTRANSQQEGKNFENLRTDGLRGEKIPDEVNNPTVPTTLGKLLLDLDNIRNYFTYQGTFTSPDRSCQVNTWIVYCEPVFMKTHMLVSMAQLSGTNGPISGNFRQTQDTNGRLVIKNDLLTSIDGQWSTWSAIDCSLSCGGGVLTKTRVCDSPPPVGNGDDCVGDAEVQETCNDFVCPVNGGWASWSIGECSEYCGGGTQVDTRTCTRPAPLGTGNDCVGNSSRTLDCNTDACGAWSEWASVSECSKTCEAGVEFYSRTCSVSDPSPVECDGLTSETKTVTCNDFECPGRFKILAVRTGSIRTDAVGANLVTLTFCTSRSGAPCCNTSPLPRVLQRRRITEFSDESELATCFNFDMTGLVSVAVSLYSHDGWGMKYIAVIASGPTYFKCEDPTRYAWIKYERATFDCYAVDSI